MKRYYAIFIGQVQGVGFRFQTYRLARKYEITGWIANRYDGSVEANFQGEDKNIHFLIAELLQPDYFIRIDDYSLKEIDLVDKENYFEIRD